MPLKTSGSSCASAVVLALVALMASPLAVRALTLFNGLSRPSQTPAQQGWLYRGTSIPTAPSAAATLAGTVLNTGNPANYAGYFRQLSTLDRTVGYSLQFSIRVNSEQHRSNNRAGFSLIVISAPVKGESQPLGIELGFWTNSIWAQNVGFTRGEAVAFNTQSAVNRYTLRVQGTTYRLHVNGSPTPILQGALRQYTGFTPPAGYPNPYAMSGLAFLGDNSTSATANVTIAQIAQ